MTVEFDVLHVHDYVYVLIIPSAPPYSLQDVLGPESGVQRSAAAEPHDLHVQPGARVPLLLAVLRPGLPRRNRLPRARRQPSEYICVHVYVFASLSLQSESAAGYDISLLSYFCLYS